MELTEAIAEIERRYYRTAFDLGANMNALLVQNAYRDLAGMPEFTRNDLRQKEIDGYKAIIADAFVAGDIEKANTYKGYIESVLANKDRF